MNGDQELIDGYLDGELTAEEEMRLEKWLAADREHIRTFVRETHLHRQLREIMLAQAFRPQAEASVEKQERAAWLSSVGSTRRTIAQWFGFPASRTLRHAGMLAVACLALVAGVWLFGPTMGQPSLAEFHGDGLSILRAGQPLPIVAGMRLETGDVLRTPANVTAVIGFAPEATRIQLLPGTELKLSSLAGGKRFDLDLGKLEASVARQRPFRPMILKTPHAEARVIGTKFSLLTTSNATRLAVAEGTVRLTRLSDGVSAAVGAGSFAVASSNYVLAVQPLPGKVLREVWLDLPGDTLQGLRSYARFPNAPSGHDFPPSFETNTNWPGAYGTRTRAYLLPPANGDYEFRLPDNVRNGQVGIWLSPDEDPADKLRICQIAFTRNRPGDESPRNTTRSQLESDPIHLQAGKRYYIEVLHTYGMGEDRLTVLWKRPDGVIEPIPSECLAPFKLNTKEKKR